MTKVLDAVYRREGKLLKANTLGRRRCHYILYFIELVKRLKSRVKCDVKVI